MADLARPPQIDDLMDADQVAQELLRTLEMHGDGLLPFDPAAEAQTGDFLIGNDRSIWLVTGVDEKGQITHIAGSAGSDKSKRDIVLVWRPNPAARNWLQPGQTAAPGYDNLDKALGHLTGLWGYREFDGYELSATPGLFLQVLGAPGLDLKADDLNSISEDADLSAYCADRGGLHAFEGEAMPVPGDIVRLGERERWGLVLRSPAKGPGVLDLLVGDERRKGPVGEPANALQIVRGYTATALDSWWRPATKKRS